ncbi:MAG: hypothetical protein HC933_13640 [Pleurocapsa sp. SU_196_0]|nr:hypothetical protein [Pleurocapsa sp. SU_196_0]
MNTAQDLLYQAYGMRDTDPAKLALLEEAVQLADAANDTKTGYEARDELIDASTFSGQGEKMLVAFAWMLNAFDANPDEYSAHSLYWKYKWVLNTARQFPQISAERIDALIADFEHRLESAGYSPRPALDARVGWARHRGRR